MRLRYQIVALRVRPAWGLSTAFQCAEKVSLSLSGGKLSCPWRQLPKDFPPKSTVHDYFVEWQCEGTLLRIHYALYTQALELAGKEASPTTAIVDSQSVRGAEKGGPQPIPWAMMRQRKSKARSGMRRSIRSV